jgi:hypothetical protein
MIPPYQTAAEETRRQAGAPIKTAATIGASVIGGSAALKKVLPFLNKLIPGELMRKGLSKVNPDIGKFIDTALNNGYGLDDIRNFMSEKFSPKEEDNQQTQENPIVKQAKDFETNYPDIIQALMSHINNGRSPQEAAAILKTSTPFSQKIKKIEKDSGKNFVDFILEMMGGKQTSQMQQPQQMQAQDPQGTPGTLPQQQSAGGLDPQLMQLMNGIRSSIQNLRGGNG